MPLKGIPGNISFSFREERERRRGENVRGITFGVGQTLTKY